MNSPGGPRDCLGAPLALGDRVSLAWTPAAGWSGRVVRGVVTRTHLGFGVLDDDGVVTIPPSGCVRREISP